MKKILMIVLIIFIIVGLIGLVLWIKKEIKKETELEKDGNSLFNELDNTISLCDYRNISCNEKLNNILKNFEEKEREKWGRESGVALDVLMGGHFVYFCYKTFEYPYYPEYPDYHIVFIDPKTQEQVESNKKDCDKGHLQIIKTTGFDWNVKRKIYDKVRK